MWCEKCHNTNIICCFNKQLQIKCCNCNEITFLSGVIARGIKKNSGHVVCTAYYYGQWAVMEIDTLEDAIRNIVKNDKWHFFKGRFVFTAWKDDWAKGIMLTAPTFFSLMDQVEHQCRITYIQ